MAGGPQTAFWEISSDKSGKRIDWLRLFQARFAIVPSSHALVLGWATAMAFARKNGRRIETADARGVPGLLFEDRGRSGRKVPGL